MASTGLRLKRYTRLSGDGWLLAGHASMPPRLRRHRALARAPERAPARAATDGDVSDDALRSRAAFVACDASTCVDRVLRIPTGFGKTAGAALPWLFHRAMRCDAAWPSRLVFCLPMRVLVEQTEEVLRGWVKRAGLEVPVVALLGGRHAFTMPRSMRSRWSEIRSDTGGLLQTHHAQKATHNVVFCH